MASCLHLLARLRLNNTTANIAPPMTGEVAVAMPTSHFRSGFFRSRIPLAFAYLSTHLSGPRKHPRCRCNQTGYPYRPKPGVPPRISLLELEFLYTIKSWHASENVARSMTI